jgi:hypothetical protein
MPHRRAGELRRRSTPPMPDPAHGGPWMLRCPPGDGCRTLSGGERRWAAPAGAAAAPDPAALDEPN